MPRTVCQELSQRRRCGKGSLQNSKRATKAIVEKHHEKVTVIITARGAQTATTTGHHGSSEEGYLPSREVLGRQEQGRKMNEGDVFYLMKCWVGQRAQDEAYAFLEQKVRLP